MKEIVKGVIVVTCLFLFFFLAMEQTAHSQQAQKNFTIGVSAP